MSTFQLNRDNAVPWLKKLGTQSVDLVLTQLPKAANTSSIATTSKVKNRDSDENRWFEIFPSKMYAGLFLQLYRVLKPNSHCYICCDQSNLFVLKPLAESAGFRFQTVLVWDRQQRRHRVGYHNQVSWICLFEKGHRPLTDPRASDLLSFPISKSQAWPVELVTLLLQQSASKGQLIIDPFMSQPEIAEIALKQGYRFAGAQYDQLLCEQYQGQLASLPGVTELLRPAQQSPQLVNHQPQLALL